MATTSNGIRYPLGSDTVNIAVDAQNLASDIDTKISQQTFGLTAAGELLGYSGSTNITIPAAPGAGYVLQADSSQNAGIRWSTDHYPNMFFIASASSTAGGTVQPILSFTDIPQIFKSIKLYIYCMVGSGTEDVRLTTINGFALGSAAGYRLTFYPFVNGSYTETVEPGSFPIMTVDGAANNIAWAELSIYNYSDGDSAAKPFSIKSVSVPTSATNNNENRVVEGFIHPSTEGSAMSAGGITSLTLQWSSTNTLRRWAAYLYGVK